MLSSIILSAALFNGAFFFSDYLGWLVIFFLVPLGFFFIRKNSSIVTIKAGFLWGLLVFGGHFTWLFDVLMSHSRAPWWLCAVMTLVVVIYFSLSSICWFAATRALYDWSKSILFALGISALGYWLFIEYLILWPARLGYGYPFINPCIPLASYKLFLRIIACIFGLTPITYNTHEKIVYIPPVVNKIKNSRAPWATDPNGVGRQIYKALYAHGKQTEEPVFLLAPESMFSFPLNNYPDIIQLWSRALPARQHFFIGTVYAEQGRQYQAVFWLQAGLIIKIYVKKCLTPFVERIPKSWRGFAGAKQAFMTGSQEFSDELITSTHNLIDTIFEPDETTRFIPQICLEFFMCGGARSFDHLRAPKKNTKILFCANDSWFNRPFRDILYKLSVLKAQLIGLPVVYVGHCGCYHINPSY